MTCARAHEIACDEIVLARGGRGLVTRASPWYGVTAVGLGGYSDAELRSALRELSADWDDIPDERIAIGQPRVLCGLSFVRVWVTDTAE